MHSRNPLQLFVGYVLVAKLGDHLLLIGLVAIPVGRNYCTQIRVPGVYGLSRGRNIFDLQKLLIQLE